MENLGHHSKIKIENREFHIHTGSIVEKSVVVSEIFEKGKFITSREIPFSARHAGDVDNEQSYVKHLTHKLHRDTMNEVKTLFFIHEKLKNLKQYVPHFKLGTVFLQKNFMQPAVKNFKRVLEIKPDFVPALKNMALCYYKLYDYDNAEVTLNKALSLQDKYPDILNAAGVIKTQKKDFQSAIELFQRAISINQKFSEVQLNLGIALFRSTLADWDEDEKIIVPQRVVRFINILASNEKYQGEFWQNLFKKALKAIEYEAIDSILKNLEEVQFNLTTHVDINAVVETFYLKFMFGGKELTTSELKEYENRFRHDEGYRREFADYWNQLGMIHMVQCRDLFLKSINEFEKAVSLDKLYPGAKKNLDLIRNNKKGFLILLRAILK